VLEGRLALLVPDQLAGEELAGERSGTHDG